MYRTIGIFNHLEKPELTPRELSSAHKSKPNAQKPNHWVAPRSPHLPGTFLPIRGTKFRTRLPQSVSSYQRPNAISICCMQTLSAYQHHMQGTACNMDWSKTTPCHIRQANHVVTKLQACPRGVFALSQYVMVVRNEVASLSKILHRIVCPTPHIMKAGASRRA